MIDLPVLKDAETPAPHERFWRSPADLEGRLGDLHSGEFMPGASDRPSGASRRDFLRIMGASMAMAGLSACRRPVEQVLPYTRQPEEIIPGEPLYYATGMPYRGVLRPILVKSHEGRPTKIEGNPEHPMSWGATGGFEQASILNMYDPDRSQRVLRQGVGSEWREFVRLAQELDGTTRIAVVSPPTSSPTIRSLRGRLAERFPEMQWITYAPEGDDPSRTGLRTTEGRTVRPLYRFSNAEVIVSLDSDFLGPTEINLLSNTAEYAQNRRMASPEDIPGRLYVVESNYSLTGGMADHRKRLRSGDIPAFAQALASQLGIGGLPGQSAMEDALLHAMARDVQAAGPRAVVVAGDTQPPEVHALAAAINQALGAVGSTVSYLDVGDDEEFSQIERFAALAADMHAGEIDLLLMLGVNPVYSAPPELDFAGGMERVARTVHLGLHLDETGQAAEWHIPQAHYLEAWGDGRAYDGTLSVVQPLIAPLYEAAKSDVELLGLLVTGMDTPGYDLVREQWSAYLPDDAEQAWRRALHDGFLPDSGYPETTPVLEALSLTAASPGEEEIEVVIRLDPTVLDGSYANNAWMMELPDPTTKIVWDNVALIGPAMAERLGVSPKYDKGRYVVDVLEITVDGRSVRLPAWIQPGLPDRSVHLTMGYGRNISTVRPPRKARFFDLDHYSDIYADGPLANGVGENVSVLRRADMRRVLSGAEVKTTGDTWTISTTQEHGYMEGRPLFRKATLSEFRERPTFAPDAVPPLYGQEEWEDYPALWQKQHPSEQPATTENPYYENQWGMVIDLNTCTGCNACVVACNSENNVQMVGKEEVGLGREMHWLRIDRYFVSGEEDTDNPAMVVQPVPCMHCENAPCEAVCPVAATVHSPDGTNQMIYNRCIGTRYCSNNCPYKVRRFSFFNWTKTLPETVQMAQNPNVTVRFRGVMEKCSYCIQRIRGAQQTARLADRALHDGEVKTACQQACGMQSITFGDLNNPDSAVVQARKNPRRYEMLAELSVKPRTSYLARVTNPNPELEPQG